MANNEQTLGEITQELDIVEMSIFNIEQRNKYPYQASASDMALLDELKKKEEELRLLISKKQKPKEDETEPAA